MCVYLAVVEYFIAAVSVLQFRIFHSGSFCVAVGIFYSGSFCCILESFLAAVSVLLFGIFYSGSFCVAFYNLF